MPRKSLWRLSRISASSVSRMVSFSSSPKAAWPRPQARGRCPPRSSFSPPHYIFSSHLICPIQAYPARNKVCIQAAGLAKNAIALLSRTWKHLQDGRERLASALLPLPWWERVGVRGNQFLHRISPSPLVGEGWGEGKTNGAPDHPPLTPPIKGGEEERCSH